MPFVLQIDAMSVYAAVIATAIQIPAERSLLSHSQYIRALLDLKVLHAIAWLGTRDMVSHALTKGCVDRVLIRALMDGKVLITHENKTWWPKAQADAA